MGEPSCHGEPVFIKYLPFIAVGAGALLVAAVLLTSKTTMFSPPMFPPYPQQGGY